MATSTKSETARPEVAVTVSPSESIRVPGPMRKAGNEFEAWNDDSENSIPGVHTKAANSLMLRFGERLASVLSRAEGSNSAVSVRIKHDAQKEKFNILIALQAQDVSDNQEFNCKGQVMLRTAARLLHLVQRYQALQGHEVSKEALRQFVLDCYKSHIEENIFALGKLLDANKCLIEDVIGDMSGALDECFSQRDQVLGSVLESIWSNLSPLSREDVHVDSLTNTMLKLAINTIGLRGAEHRLTTTLANSSLATKVYRLVCGLAAPDFALNTILRFVRTFPAVATATLHLGTLSDDTSAPSAIPSLLSSSSTRMVSSDCARGIQFTSQSSPASGMASLNTSRARKHGLHSAGPLCSDMDESEDTAAANLACASKSPHAGSDFPTLIEDPRIWLQPHERSIPVHKLMPKAKHQAFLLVQSLLAKHNPEPDTDAYRVFGYQACSNAREENQLGWYYSEVLWHDNNRPEAFRKLWQALECGTIIELLDQHGLRVFRKRIPKLEAFLKSSTIKTPTECRKTVYLLQTFVRDKGNLRPPEYLLRDYGFHLCRQHQEISKLKEIYEVLFARADALQIHEACIIEGGLIQLADTKKLGLKPRWSRLLKNQHWVPGAGYEEMLGGYTKQGGVFKR